MILRNEEVLGNFMQSLIFIAAAAIGVLNQSTNEFDTKGGELKDVSGQINRSDWVEHWHVASNLALYCR
jgi:hypothetical protein